ncbi:hypothetical protein CHCC15325_2293 [Bacillus licheniformis]|nr:hypothetical protein CHCC5024_0590 [Bacillus licheniformis]TWK56250.1 hypothetical protein CHCC20344_3044 [Bacillus licheniformis]TWK75703.1 hypothetical protein CHCC20341_3514 [Bacillus licheniformis]TWL38955.1 hypothetical protein CHCC15543_3887 [Bacillus licheniformis]TWL52961.1 hypothetical protein CHCC15325_2293 [Bacillus licheniformis]
MSAPGALFLFLQPGCSSVLFRLCFFSQTEGTALSSVILVHAVLKEAAKF